MDSLNLQLFYACKEANYQQIGFLLKKIVDVNFGLRGACEGGHIDIVRKMISKGANDWNEALCCACEGGHLELAQMMIDKGADVNYGLQGACFSNHLELIQMMIDNGANKWNKGLLCACAGGHNEIVQMMIDKGATSVEHGVSTWDSGLQYACLHDKIKTAQMMIDLGADDWNAGFFSACMNNNVSLARIMIEKGASNLYELFEQGPLFIVQLLLCLQRIHLHRVQTFIEKEFKQKKKNHLINRHTLKPYVERKILKTIYSVGQSFVCKDVTTFMMRFVGFY